MAKRSKSGPARGRHVSGNPARRAAAEAERLAPSAFRPYDALLTSEDAGGLLELASSLLQTARRSSVDLGVAESRLTEMAVDDPAPSATAVLVAMATLARTDEGRRYAVDAYEARLRAGHRPPPPWVSTLDAIRVTGTALVQDDLAEQQQVMVELTPPGVSPFLLVVDVDASLPPPLVVGTGTHPCTLERHVPAHLPSGLHAVDSSPGAVGARLVELFATTVDEHEPSPAESDPLGALVDWVIGQLPDDVPSAAPHAAPREAPDQAAVVTAFLASQHARHLDRAEDGEVVRRVVAMLGDVDGEDAVARPTRRAVLDVMTRARWTLANQDALYRTPAVLRAYVEWAHGRSGVGRSATSGVLSSVDDAVVLLIRGEVPPVSAPDASLAALRREAAMAPEEVGLDLVVKVSEVLEHLRDAAGGEARLWQLDGEPLPVEDLDLGVLPDDVRSQVSSVLDALDLVHPATSRADDAELRTVVGRVLRRLLGSQPRQAEVLRNDPDELAAAIVVVAVGANHPWEDAREQIITGASRMGARELPLELAARVSALVAREPADDERAGSFERQRREDEDAVEQIAELELADLELELEDFDDRGELLDPDHQRPLVGVEPSESGLVEDDLMDEPPAVITLGDADLLISAQRALVIEMRDAGARHLETVWRRLDRARSGS